MSPFLLRALSIREKALGPEHREVAASLNNLATIYHDLEKHEQAVPYLLRALAIVEKALGPNHPEVATSLENIGVLYGAMDRNKEADEVRQRAARIRAMPR